MPPADSRSPAWRLATELATTSEWPPARERQIRQTVAERRAFRRGDRPILKRLANWGQHTTDGTERPYIVDPLGKVICRAHADFLFGEDPRFTHDDDTVQDRINQTVVENRLPASLHRAERVCVSEGEVWWKLHVNAQVLPDVALIEFRSRLAVIPLLYGDRVLACAFVTERRREPIEDTDGNPSDRVWRHAEIHGPGLVLNQLFVGTDSEIGSRVPLGRLPELGDLLEEWEHGLDMLAGRIVNDLDDDPRLGDSDLDQVRDELLAVNEAMTIATENARLTGQDRIFAAGRFIEADGTFDSSLQVFQVEQEGQTLGEPDSRPPIVAIEKHYDAEPLWTHVRQLVSTVLTRVGLVPQMLGDSLDGRAESGTAIRLRFLPTVNVAMGKAREWDHSLPHMLDLMLRLAALPVEDGGLGQGPYDPDMPPSLERGNILPVDESEDIAAHAAAVAGEIESRETAVKALHQDWSQDQVDEELRKIRDDSTLALAGHDLPPALGV